MHGAMQVHFHALVDAFALAIHLGVIRRGVEQLGARVGEEFAPECTGEDAIAVGDDGARDAVELDDLIPEDLGHLWSFEGVVKGDEVR